MKTMWKSHALSTFVAVFLSTVLLIPGFLSSSTAQDDAIFDSPLPTPPVPTPTPIPSTEAQVALRYITERYGVAVEQLAIVNEHRREYSELSRAFQAFTLLDLANDRFFNLLVDLKDHVVVEDVAAIQRAEEDAYQKRYGKLEPALHDRLQKAADDEPIEVAIWIAGSPRRSQQELFAELAARFPEAKAAMERSGKPFDVQDPELRAKIEQAYDAMAAADTQPLVQPVVDVLRAQGYTVTTYDAMPSVSTVLPKQFILALSKRPDVGRMFLIEGEGELLLDSAVPADRVSPVWQAGIDGTGSSIAILETDNVDFTSNSPDCPPWTNNCFRHPGVTRPGIDGVLFHASLVAGSAASDHGSHKGVAPDATIHSAGMAANTEAAFVDGLQWALGSYPGPGADVVNVSWGRGGRQDMRWSDWALDYWAHYYSRMVVAAAGNQPNCNSWGEFNLCSPAKAWNVISVGAYDNANSPNWSDDTMADFSCYANPSINREKPEVVAPGVEIAGIGTDGNLISRNGTSYASPQVAGLAASLIERESNLRGWPEASRAIIMASAVHNIEGPSGIPSGQELKDGAGGIDAALADLTAKTRWVSETSACTGPCWWGISINNTNFPVGDWLYRYFNASRGEHIRAAISWWSHAHCPSENDCTYDRLDTDLQFGVMDPSGQWVNGGWSASWDNNYELVDFTAPATGKYKLAVYKERADESSNYLGLAWVKDATYMPDVRGNYGGWNSVLRVRNDGATQRDVYVTFFNRNGTPVANPHLLLNRNQVWAFNAASVTGSNFAGSASVNGGEDVSVAVMNIHQGTPYSTGSYTGLREAGQTLNLPLLQRANNSMYADFTLFNAGTAQATVQVQYIPENGSYWGCTATNISIPSNGSRNFNSRDGTLGCTTSSPFVGGARVTSNQPLVAVANQWRDVGADGSIEGLMSYEAFPTGGTVSHMPLLQYNNNGWYTSSNLQDTSGGAATATIRYYPEDGAGQCGSVSRPLAANDIEIVFPSPPFGTCTPQGKFVGTGYATRSYSFAAVVNQEEFATGNQKMCYGAVRGGSTAVILPWVMKDKDGWQGRNNWYSGINVENVGSAITHVTVTYYDNNGNWVYTEPVRQVSPLATTVYLPAPEEPGPATFAGSAVVTTDNGQPVAVVVNHFSTDGSDDTFMSYTGVNH